MWKTEFNTFTTFSGEFTFSRCSPTYSPLYSATVSLTKYGSFLSSSLTSTTSIFIAVTSFMVSPGIGKCKSRQEDVNRLLYIFLAAYPLVCSFFICTFLISNHFYSLLCAFIKYFCINLSFYSIFSTLDLHVFILIEYFSNKVSKKL